MGEVNFATNLKQMLASSSFWFDATLHNQIIVASSSSNMKIDLGRTIGPFDVCIAFIQMDFMLHALS